MFKKILSLLKPKLSVGREVRLFGGYEMDPEWLGGKTHYLGTCVAFIKGQKSKPAAVIELEEFISFKTMRGNIAVLELRYANSQWGNTEIVHIELCDFTLEDKPWKDRKQGLWAESHACYTVT